MLEKRLSLIATRMTLLEAFLAAVYLLMEVEIVDDPEFTAAVNGKVVRYGRQFCDNLNDSELLFVALHETMHVALMHCWRRGGRDPLMWNIANDAIINMSLRNMGYKTPADAVLFDWVTNDMSSEDVYHKLLSDPDKKPSQGSGQGDDQGDGNGERIPGKGSFGASVDLEDAPVEASEVEMEAVISTAARMAKACGVNSSLVDRILGGELSPKQSWSEVLRSVLTASQRNDYTYRRFNRRMLGQGMYLPALYNESMGGLGIGWDTSGSVSDEEMNQIAAEVNSIIADLSPDWVEVVYCDSEIKHVERFENGDIVKFNPKGGGGTSFKPVFDHFDKATDRVAAVVYFTDLYGDTNIPEPEYPTVWALSTNRQDDVPFGIGVRV